MFLQMKEAKMEEKNSPVELLISCDGSQRPSETRTWSHVNIRAADEWMDRDAPSLPPFLPFLLLLTGNCSNQHLWLD